MHTTATRTITILAIILFSLTMTALAQRGQDIHAIQGVDWGLIEANGRRVQRSPAYINVDRRTSRLSGNTGCNEMFGNVVVRGDRINFTSLGSTRRACRPEAGGLPEATLVRLLERVVRYQIGTNQQLRLIDRRGVTVLKFRPTRHENGGDAGTQRRLENHRWVLESIGNRRTFAPIRGVFINFDREKRGVGGDTGCNVFGGSYTADRDTIRITDVMSTMRACEEGNKMQVERDLLDGMRRADRYRLDDDRLFLYQGTHLLLTFRGERK